LAPFRIARPRLLAYLAFEGGLIFLVLYGLTWLTPLLVHGFDRPGSLGAVFLAGACFFVVLFVTQWSNPTDKASLIRETVVFTLISLLLGLLAFGTLYVAASDRSWPASGLLLLEGALVVPLAVAAWRWLTMRFEVLNVTRETVLIVGTGETAKRLCRWVGEKHGSEYAVLGFVDEGEARLGSVLAWGARVQCSYRTLARFAGTKVDRVIVALDEKRGKLPVRELMALRLRGVEIEEATSFLERVSGRISIETMLPSWLIYSDGFKNSAMRAFLKRTVDVVNALTLLVLSMPLMVVVAVLIKLDSRGPVLYRQVRVGRGGREFSILKFRSMRADAESLCGPTWARENDPRVTRLGRVLRKLRVDELPQLFNVLRGEMSFVGPRPERPHFVKQLEQSVPYYGLRMTARPGITGWAQVEYGYGGSKEDAHEKLQYDLYYIKNSNVFFDLWIVTKTAKVVALGRGAR
jgi:sugar transferase (PEP-CTERM system associated)